MAGGSHGKHMSNLLSLPKRGPTRVLVLLDQPLVAEIVAFTLNHGVFETRTATSVDEAKALLTDWGCARS
jgi:hypothetical protein